MPHIVGGLVQGVALGVTRDEDHGQAEQRREGRRGDECCRSLPACGSLGR